MRNCWQAFALILLLSLTNGALTPARDARIDPGRITQWWNTWTARPIELSRSNAGNQVDITFKFRVTTQITLGCVEVQFPNSITPPGAGASNEYQVCNQNYEAGEDAQVIVPGVTLPVNAGAYGPFHIITRDFAGGQIIDIGANFGSIYVKPNQVTRDGTNGVLYVTAEEEVEIRQRTELEFRFRIDFDIWKRDVLVLASPWKVDQFPECETVPLNENSINYFNSTNSSHQFGCVSDSSQIYIYGFGDDIDVNLLGQEDYFMDIKFKIGKFTAPDFDGADTDYIWKLEVLRQNTREVVRLFNGFGTKTKPGSVEVQGWRPHSDFSQYDIVKDLTMFTTVTFLPKNSLPSTGSIVLVFSGVSIKSNLWYQDADASAAATPPDSLSQDYCYVKWLGQSSSCTIDTIHSLTINGFTELTMNEPIEVTIQSKFLTDMPSVNVVTYYNTNLIVDVSEDYHISLSQDAVKADRFKLTFSDSNGSNDVNTTGPVGNKFINSFVVLQLQDFSNETGNLKIHLPITNGERNDFAIYINNNPQSVNGSFLAQYKTQSRATENEDATPFTQTNLAANQGTNYIELTDISLESVSGGVFQFYNYYGSQQSLYLPEIASNLATRYEAWLEFTVGTTKFVGIQVLTFVASNLTFSLNRLCGNVAQFTVGVAFDVDLQEPGKSYRLDFTFNAGFGATLNSNLTSGEDYPYAYTTDSNFDNITKLTLITSGSQAILRLTDQDSYLSSISYTFYTTVGNGGGTGVVPDLYYVKDGDDPNLKFYYQRNSGQNLSDVSAGSAHALSSSGDVNVLDQRSYTTNVIDWGAIGTFQYTAQLPIGFTFSSPTLTVEVTSSNLKVIQSTNKLFAFPAVVGSATITSQNQPLNVSNVVASNFVGTSVSITTGIAGTCGVATFDVNSETITITEQTPQSIRGRGPDQQQTPVSIRFRTTNGVPAGGYIELTLNNNWIVVGDCTVSGLENLDANTAVSCSTSGNTATIQNFAGFEGAVEISVEFDDVVPPINNGGGDIQYPHVSTITSYYIGGRIIDSLISSVNSCTVSARGDIGISTMLQRETIPPNGQEVGVDVYLRFTLEHSLHANGTLNISAPTSWTLSSIAKNDVYLSIPYTSVSVISGSLVFSIPNEILAGQVIELYADDAMTNPNSSGGVFGYFLVRTQYQGFTVDEDVSSTNSVQHQIQVQPELTSGITLPTNYLTVDVTTANVYVDYTFRFTIEVEFLETDELWIKFPYSFSPYMADAEIKFPWYKPDQYYVDCSSDQLGGDIECIADHWWLIIREASSQGAGTELVITIFDVMNPASTLPGTPPDFKIYHVNENGVGKAKNSAVTSLAITALPSNLVIKTFGPENHNANTATNYSTEWYANIDLTTITQLDFFIMLPRQYNHNLSGESISCSFTTQNHANDSTDLSEPSNSGFSSCAIDGKWISSNVADTTGFVFNSTTKYNWIVQGLMNPEWGLEREKEEDFAWDFDANDFNFFQEYEKWTGPIEMYIQDPINLVVIQKSYLDVNAPYTGLNFHQRGFKVNNYDAEDFDNQITIIPGTQTADISITTLNNELFAARELTFTPTVNSSNGSAESLIFSSVEHDFKIFHYEDSINFRVSTPANVAAGVYYIDWAIEEAKQNSQFYEAYNKPVRTRVEVNPTTLATFNVESIQQVIAGFKSLPVRIWTDNAPNTDVTVNLALNSSETETGITIIPTELQFKPDINEQWFEIQVDANVSSGVLGNNVITYTYTGTNSAQYQPLSQSTFSITSNSQTIAAGVLSTFALVVNSNTRVSVQFEARANNFSLLYYQYSPIGTDTPTFQELKTNLGDYFQINVDPNVDETIRTEDYESNSGETWKDYSRRLFKSHMQIVWRGAALLDDNISKTFTIEGLYADTTYQVWGYVDRMTEVESELSTFTFFTRSMPPAATFEMRFPENEISENFLPVLTEIVATTIGISTKRMLDGTRMLKQQKYDSQEIEDTRETLFYWTIPAIRNLQSPTPLEEITLNNSQIKEINERIQRIGIMEEQASYAWWSIDRALYTDPEWKQEPKLKSTSTTQLTYEMKVNVVGECCGVALITPDNALNNNQLLLGLNEDNQITPSACVAVTDPDKSVEVSLSGLEVGTNYDVRFGCFNEYPVWPDSMEVDDVLQHWGEKISTYPLEEDSSMYLALVVVILVV